MGVTRDPRRGRRVDFLGPIKLYDVPDRICPWFRLRLQWLKEMERFWTLKKTGPHLSFSVVDMTKVRCMCGNEQLCPCVLVHKNRYKTPHEVPTAKQGFVMKGVQWLFLLWICGTEHDQTNCLWRQCGVSLFKEPLSQSANYVALCSFFFKNSFLKLYSKFAPLFSVFSSK